VRIVTQKGESDLATVYVAELADGKLIEFVESVQPPYPRDAKWILIISTLRGCPVSCPICDAGTTFAGRLTFAEIIGQIDYLVQRRYTDGKVPVSKFKIQFARMGDPAFNPAVIDVLHELPFVYDAPGLIPSISTIAPAGCMTFLDRVKDVKNRLYSDGRFQMQFSIHTSSEDRRRELIPCRTLSFSELNRWGEDFFCKDDRKISLNFAVVKGYPLDPQVIADTFSPENFMIKLTPVNPTLSSVSRGFKGVIDPEHPETADEYVRGFRNAGFDTILSIGQSRENHIGSNCGMFVGRLSRNPEEKALQTLSARTVEACENQETHRWE